MAALASLASGVVLDLVGYELMAVVGAAIAIFLGLVIVGDRRANLPATVA